jgi:hypothetical protein
VKFLTDTMKSSKSERVRMQAALRLADVLILRENREQAELRAITRRLEAEGRPPATPEPPEGVCGQELTGNKEPDVKAIWGELAAQLKGSEGRGNETA